MNKKTHKLEKSIVLLIFLIMKTKILWKKDPIMFELQKWLKIILHIFYFKLNKL